MRAICTADPADAIAIVLAQARGGPLEQLDAVEEQEEGEGEHDDRLDQVVEQADGDLLAAPGGVAELRRELRGLLGEQLGDVVLVVELAELLVVVGPVLEVLDVGGQLRRRAARPRARSAGSRRGPGR